MMSKTLVTYAFFRRSGEIHKDNLEFFLKAGVSDTDVADYNVVLTNPPYDTSLIPDLRNLYVVKRENDGHDFGGYKASIEHSNINDYENFIFINDTCTGPFLPSYAMKHCPHWTKLFCSELDEKVKLVGPTWWNTNKAYSPHIQSWCFGTDRKGLDILIRGGTFETSGKPRSKIIPEHEVGASELIINSGYEIKPFQLSRISKKEHGDINYPSKYFGATINPIEIMFSKRSRINDIVTQNYMEWILKSYK